MKPGHLSGMNKLGNFKTMQNHHQTAKTSLRLNKIHALHIQSIKTYLTVFDLRTSRQANLATHIMV